MPKNIVEIQKLAQPVDGYLYKAVTKTSTDDGKTYHCSGPEKMFATLAEASIYKQNIEYPETKLNNLENAVESWLLNEFENCASGVKVDLMLHLETGKIFVDWRTTGEIVNWSENVIYLEDLAKDSNTLNKYLGEALWRDPDPWIIVHVDGPYALDPKDFEDIFCISDYDLEEEYSYEKVIREVFPKFLSDYYGPPIYQCVNAIDIYVRDYADDELYKKFEEVNFS